jgi:O-antigen ligase
MTWNWEKILFWILVLVVVTLPLQVTKIIFPFYFFGSSFPILEVSRILILVGIIVLVTKLIFTGKIIVPKDAISILLLVFVFLSSLSLVIFRSDVGLLEVIRYVFYLGFLFLVVNAIRNTVDLEKVTRAFLIGGFGISLFSVFQYFSGFYLWNSGLALPLARVNATFFDPNVLATFLGILIITSTAYYSFSTDRRYRILSVLVSSTSVAAIFYTFSRAGLVSFVVAFLALVVVLPKTIKNFILYLFLIALSVTLIFTTPNIKSRISDIYVIAGWGAGDEDLSQDTAPTPLHSWDVIDIKDKNICALEWKSRQSAGYQNVVNGVVSLVPLNGDRNAAVRAGIYMLIDNPIFGVGVGNFQSEYLGNYCHLINVYDRPVSSGNPITLSHTSFVTIAAEFGLVGISWLILFLLALALVFIRSFKMTPQLKNVVLLSITSLLLLFLHTQFRGGLFSDPYFWLLSGLVIVGKNLTAVKNG